MLDQTKTKLKILDNIMSRLLPCRRFSPEDVARQTSFHLQGYSLGQWDSHIDIQGTEQNSSLGICILDFLGAKTWKQMACITVSTKSQTENQTFKIKLSNTNKAVGPMATIVFKYVIFLFRTLLNRPGGCEYTNPHHHIQILHTSSMNLHCFYQIFFILICLLKSYPMRIVN